MKEAAEEIEEDDAKHDGTGRVAGNGDVIPLEEMEEGGRHKDDAAPRSASKRSTGSVLEGARNFCSFFLGPVFVKAFVLTFLGEWGDRSQIATIALGAAHNAYLVAAGTIIGHTCCTGAAVIGGKYISTKISVRNITLGGAILFLLFGVIYFYEAFAESTADEIPIPIN